MTEPLKPIPAHAVVRPTRPLFPAQDRTGAASAPDVPPVDSRQRARDILSREVPASVSRPGERRGHSGLPALPVASLTPLPDEGGSDSVSSQRAAADSSADEPVMPDKGRGTPLKDNPRSATEIYRDLQVIQQADVKAVIVGFGNGSVYYPQEGGKVIEVNIGPIDPLSVWLERGFTESDLRSGLVRLVTSREFDASEIYDRPVGPSWGETIDELWVSGTGSIFRSRWEEGAASSTFERDENPLDPRYKDAIRRVQQLSAIPREIKEFGGYQAFKDALIAQGTKLNGIDEVSSWSLSDGERPWVPFSAVRGLRTFVDGLITAESLDKAALDRSIGSGDWELRKSIDGNPHRVDGI